MIEPGATVEEFELHDDHGEVVRWSQFRGKPIVVFFYPRADTPGCTKEACAFRDLRAEFDARGVEVIGASGDKIPSQAKFREKYGLTVRLLADPEHRILEPWGVWKEKTLYGKKSMGIQRSTFIFDSSGVLRHVWPNVKVDGHADAVLKKVTELFG
jgi:peroxiredoxin Q/BCP